MKPSQVRAGDAIRLPDGRVVTVRRVHPASPGSTVVTISVAERSRPIFLSPLVALDFMGHTPPVRRRWWQRKAAR